MKPLPTWEDFNVPVLSVLSDGVVRTLRELRRDVAAAIGLTDEQVAEVLPSGQPRADNRIGWAASYLNRVDALNRPTRGCYEITAFGRELLAKRPSGITESHLKAVAKSGDEWWITRRTVDGQTEVVQVEEPTTTLDPTEQVEQGIARIHEEVASELLSRLHGQEPAFFESAVVRLLLAMGYGGVGGRGVTTARSNDGGIDGVIDQDMFGTSFDTSADRFQNYYKDLSLRLKRREIDLVIVVNMFLTGFDATTLNTLWVDKNLRAHGLIQAFSRTNRILNSVKTFGNIVSFRDLEEETNDAIALFGNKDARGVVLLKPYDEYHDEYADKVGELLERFPLGQQIIGEAVQKKFIALFGAILRLRNILQSFDDFAGDQLLSDREVQGLHECLPRPVRRVPGDPRRREGVYRRRRRLRDRAGQAGRDQRRLHPDVGRAASEGQGR